MSVEAAGYLVAAIGLYLGLGLVFGLIFVFALVKRIDPAADPMPIQARLFILPGVTLLWPLMLVKTVAQKEPPIS
ncbi:MAG: hypothetical protein AAFQ67_00220 [Pseudomonadota bacterium]